MIHGYILVVFYMCEPLKAQIECSLEFGQRSKIAITYRVDQDVSQLLDLVSDSFKAEYSWPTVYHIRLYLPGALGTAN